ncbi:MAG: hypothetical protein JO297_04790 [Nitrososphaeraceae archaeon]|nr:hypothetical protein [Nitrososphaeraceae archaeon]
MQGYRDGAICTHQHTPQYNSGFTAGCHDKRAGLLQRPRDIGALINNNARCIFVALVLKLFFFFCAPRIIMIRQILTTSNSVANSKSSKSHPSRCS